MSVIRVGSTSKYAEGWDTIFGGRSRATTASAKKPLAKKKPAAKATKKKASRSVKKKTVTKARRPGKSRRG